jgi:hypothetical protein
MRTTREHVAKTALKGRSGESVTSSWVGLEQLLTPF